MMKNVQPDEPGEQFRMGRSSRPRHEGSRSEFNIEIRYCKARHAVPPRRRDGAPQHFIVTPDMHKMHHSESDIFNAGAAAYDAWFDSPDGRVLARRSRAADTP
jgi:hypothetical protein